MQTKRSFPVRFFLFCCGLLVTLSMLSACSVMPGLAAASSDPPPTSIGVTPVDTSPGTLDVIVTITEYQDAPSHLSDIAFSFSTTVIENPNYVQFDDPNEEVICNGAIEKLLGNTPSYSFPIPRRPYSCRYIGNDIDNSSRPDMTTFDVPLRSTLSPQLPTITSGGFSLRYTPDAPGTNCKISATAIDRAGDPSVVGSFLPSTTGTYSGPSTSGLKGTGDIELTRNCDIFPSSSFHSLVVHYVTQASIEVTWTT